MVSLDIDGSSRLSFFFDKKNFILDNALYPQILTPDTDYIEKLVRIKTISVYRIRKDIKEIND